MSEVEMHPNLQELDFASAQADIEKPFETAPSFFKKAQTIPDSIA
ncbi:hypothetical protein PBT90_19290 [Algoriphagus halophytocola]|uniref:Uncharacterized protein n=1 Tax=Algoriphagus halophytocola TaxID=2991499 RepID=A0ABY6MD79_9BACT|nr:MULTISPECIES: hypothetical protein [unclassified Algoriphagus]UZD21660.1 hypothetical protein OM944_13425 [Algoriphagus sp. TR-M5]WBL42872.1 hypothetical protein PBT90_19290 [Algoriphagus sp. TR-M9]